jgi:perosamine synthetase
VTDRIPLSRPALGAREEELVLEVLRSGRLSLGPMLHEFERRFAGLIGAANVSAVSSGTAGLHLATRAAGIQPGDEVVTSPFSFVASANCLLYEGAKPVFADVDPVSLNLDPGAAEAAVGEKTAGILPIHIFGHPAAMEAFEKLAAARGLGLLEDACEALCAQTADGVTVGARGNLAAFGFYANKQMTTGEGGVIVPRGAESAARLRSLRNQGRAVDMGWLDHDRLGWNYRLTELQAALGIAQLERLEELLGKRERVARLYEERLAALDGAGPAGEGDPAGLVLPGRVSEPQRRTWFVYTVRLPVGANRDAVIADLDRQGISAKAYLPCIHLMPHYRERYGFRGGEFPVAEEASSRSVALPFFGAMGEGDIDRVAGALAEALRAPST